MKKSHKPFHHVCSTLLKYPEWQERQNRYEQLRKLFNLEPTRSRRKMGKQLEVLRDVVKAFGYDHASWWVYCGAPFILTEPYNQREYTPPGILVLELPIELAPRAGGTRAFLCTLPQHMDLLQQLERQILSYQVAKSTRAANQRKATK